MDEGKFFRGLSKVREPYMSPETMQRMLELDDRLLGIRIGKKKAKRGFWKRLMGSI